MVKVTLTANLKKYFPKAKLELEARSVREVLKLMDEERPLFSTYIIQENGHIRKHVNVFIDGKVLHDRSAIDTPLPPDCEVHIMQALSGG